MTLWKYTMHNVIFPPFGFSNGQVINSNASLPSFASQFQPNWLDHNSLFSILCVRRGGFTIMTNGLVSITTSSIAVGYWVVRSIYGHMDPQTPQQLDIRKLNLSHQQYWESYQTNGYLCLVKLRQSSLTGTWLCFTTHKYHQVDNLQVSVILISKDCMC